MIVWYEQDQFLFEEWPHVEIGVVERQVHERSMQLPANNVRDERRRTSFADDRVDAWMVARHAGEKRRHEPTGDGADHPDAGITSDIGVSARDIGADVVEFVHDSSGALDHALALVGHSAGRSLDERHAKLAFKLCDMSRNIRLHGVESTRCRRETSVFCDGDQCRELPEVHL